MSPERIDHICIAVKDLNSAVLNYDKLLGSQPLEYYENEDECLRVARYKVGEVYFELMEDTSGTGPVAKFIEKRGEGFFCLAFKVEDTKAALDQARAKGFKTIDETPRPWQDTFYAFLRPDSTNGVLTEFI